ncbi:MAG TPA: protein kinase [Planctomycetota bacterium]|nr:protein kinase [Planctomycetota bacterium]
MDPDTPTQPIALERQLAAYFEARSSGLQPDADAYAAQLATDELRQRFHDALQHLDVAQGQPAKPVQAETVLAGRYELREAIGSGGTGQVWRAHDRKLGHEVAVKVLNPIASAAIDVDQLVEREGKMLAKLSHPGVVRVQDSGRDGPHRFVVMDLVGGKALDDVIDALHARRSRGKALSAADLLAEVGAAPPGRAAPIAGDESWPIAATKVFVELLRTLEATHGVGVVHRDLKPGNVRLAGGGVPVLLDFGMCFDAGKVPGKLTGRMFGTAPYAAPEQWESFERLGVHTDIYQAGVVLYELLTLERCFDEPSPVDTMLAIRTGSFAKPRSLDRGIDPRLEACVLRAMDVDPARRYRSAGEFRADLERFLAGDLPIAAARLRTVSWRVRTFVRHHRRSLGLAAAAGLGAVAVVLLRGEPGPQLQWLTNRSMSVQLAAPSRMLAFRVARDPDGTRHCAPLRLRVGDPAAPADLAQSLPAGDSKVLLEDLGDAARLANSIVSTIFVDPNDKIAAADFERAVGAMRQASHLVEDRNGEWVSDAEFFALLQPARGSAGVELPTARLLEPGAWQARGLRGVVIAPQAALAVLLAAQEPAAPPRTLALLVGIAEYAAPRHGDGPARLEGPMHDIERAKALLVGRFGFDPAGITTLLGAQATHEAIVSTFHRELIQRAGPDTRVVFWFSGHGSRVPDASHKDNSPREEGEGAFDNTLLAYDSRAVDPAGSYDVTDDELHSLLLALKSKDVVVVTDCCYSGGVLRGRRDGGVREGDAGTAPLDRTKIERFWPGASVPLLDDDVATDLRSVVQVAACSALEQAGEIATPLGTFGTLTWFLTTALDEVDKNASWGRVGAIVRARVAGHGTRGTQRVQIVGDAGRALFGGRGRDVPPGYYQVDRFGPADTKRFLVAAGSLHGIGEGAELQLVDLDGKEVGAASVYRVGTTSCNAQWTGAGDVPDTALRAWPKTIGDARARLRVLLGEGVDAGLLLGCDVAAATSDRDGADCVLRARGDRLELCDADGKHVLRSMATERTEVQQVLLREHLFRSLWQGVAAPGRFRVGITVAPATAQEAEKLGIPVAMVRAWDAGRAGAVVGATPIDEKPTGGLVDITVVNDNDEDLHIAIVSACENREVNVLFGKDANNVVRAHDSYTKCVWLGPGIDWPADVPMVDRYVAIATPRYADFNPFESGAGVTRGESFDNLPPFLQAALGGGRTRGDMDAPAWGIGLCDLQLVTPAVFEKTKGK